MVTLFRSSCAYVFAFVLLSIVSGGCGRAENPPAVETKAPEKTKTDPAAEALLKKMTDRIVSAKSVRIEGTLQLSGAIDVDLTGSFVAKDENVVQLQYTGTVRGDPVTVFLNSDGKTMKGGPRHLAFSKNAPPALRKNILADLIRNGLTAKVMTLLSGSDTGLADGEAQQGSIDAIVFGNRIVLEKKQVRALNFDIRQNDKEAGLGTLWVREDELPLRRGLYVRYPRELIVIERYIEFEVEE